MPKVRLDHLMVERSLAESRTQAQAMVMAGEVRVNGQVELKPSSMFIPSVEIAITAAPRFVSRGGEKLDAALTSFSIDVSGSQCADIGASTGGFTDCLLQHGAEKVFAIDVGKGLLHWKLRTDPRVVIMEATNARYIEKLPGPVNLVTVDASFISLKILLPVVTQWCEQSEQIRSADLPGKTNFQVIALIKPQFEAGRRNTARGRGVIRDAAIHRQVLLDILSFTRTLGWKTEGLIRSPLLGPKGNTEFLAWMQKGVQEEKDIDSMILALFPAMDQDHS